MEEKRKKQVDSWISGVSYEVAFWNGYLSNRKNATAILEKVAMERELNLSGLSFLDVQNPVDFKVLDVGCGMVYANGQNINGIKCDFHYVDPLANFYNEIALKKKLDIPKIEFGMIEYLSSFYGKNTVSLVIVQNALDHCFDPIKGIKECLKTLKVGGKLYLFHRKNEAEHENYQGFHQYNIDLENGHLICWNKEQHIDVTEFFSEEADVIVTEIDEHITAILTKKADSVSDDNDSYDLANQLMYAISHFLSSKFVFTYTMKYTYQKFFHFFSGKFGSVFKEKIKRILGR